MIRRPPRSTLFPLHDALPISAATPEALHGTGACAGREFGERGLHVGGADRKSTRLNSSHLVISYAVFCLKKKKQNDPQLRDENTHTYTSVHGVLNPPYQAGFL